MIAEDFFKILTEFNDRNPFKPFVVEMNDGTLIEIDRPNSLAFRGGGAAGLARGNRYIDFKSVDVRRIVEAPNEPAIGMSADDFQGTIRDKLSHEPFEPFVVELNDGNRIEFDRPNSLAVRGGLAGGFAKGGKIVIIEAANVKQVR